MHHPKFLRSKRIRSAMFPAALLCVIVSGCADQQPVGPEFLRVPRVGDVPLRRVSDVPFSKFFVAWSESYNSSPIQMQLFKIDARQDRQFVDFYVNQDILAFARANPGRLYIDGDEPDQYCVAPYDYAGNYHDFVAAIRGADPTARFSPAGFAEPNYKCCPLPDDVRAPCWDNKHSLGFAEDFYNAYIERYRVAPPVDEWRFHDFGLRYAQGDVEGWWSRIDQYAAWSVAHGANMVLGSWGFMGWREDAPAYQEHLKQAIGRLMNDPRILASVYWSYQQWFGNPHYLTNGDYSLTPEGETFTNPLTDVPVSLKLVASASGHARVRWTNTTSAWGAEAEFWAQAPGSNEFVYRKTERVAGPGDSQTSFLSFNSGEVVKARVRYYNPYGQAGWSSFSNTVVMPQPEPTGDQGTIFRKRPLFCFLRLC